MSKTDSEVPLVDLDPTNIRESDLSRLPQMTGWFHPLLLLKLLWRVIVSDLFGQYADRRLIEASLDPVPPETQVKRAQSFQVERDSEGAMWIDYVSDLGDGFDATYAIAYTLAQHELQVSGQKLRRGGLLIMGGDEVYPTALREDYKVKCRLPYELAWPAPKDQAKTPLFALPGNHDWYDGLVNFLAVFCRERGKEIGGWKAQQKRSYFAVQLSDEWWIWGIDIALVRDMDQPQADYFEAIADAMKQNASIILCSAEPGWYSAETQGGSYKTLSYAALIARRAKKNIHIPIVLSGDTHHYARYLGDGSHYITSGGGGAFLHGTLELKPKIEAHWLQSAKEELNLQCCYPSKEDSHKLLSGNSRFGKLNPGLTYVLATVYLTAAFIFTYAPRLDVALGILALLMGCLWGYSAYQEKNWVRTAVPSLIHTALHYAVILGASFGALWIWEKVAMMQDLHWFLWLVVLAVPIMMLGPTVAGKLFGWNLWLGCRVFDIGHNDAFSSMRLNSHRHFIRIRIKGNEATVFPVKLDTVPSRDGWVKNRNAEDATASVFVPKDPLIADLIESPIAISTTSSSSTSEIKTPAEQVRS